MDMPVETPEMHIDAPVQDTILERRIVIPFQLNAVGHLMVDGAIEGNPISILVDTGASSTVLHRATAEKLGITGTVADFSGGGVGNAEMEVITLGELDLTIAGQCVRDVQAYAMDLSNVGTALSQFGVGQPDMVLGTDVLIARSAVIDYGAGEIRLDAEFSNCIEG